jgi:hypothetical protein
MLRALVLDQEMRMSDQSTPDRILPTGLAF